MKIISGLTVLMLAFCVFLADAEADDIQNEDSVCVDNAFDLVGKALHYMGKDSVRCIVETGADSIDNEQVRLLSAGEESADGVKYTALYHFAVSESGKIYFLDAAAGAEWELIETAEAGSENNTGIQTEDSAAMQGMYARTDSTERDNGVLSLKYLSDGMFVFELELFSNAETAIIAGIINVDDTGKGQYDLSEDATGDNLLDFYVDKAAGTVRVEHVGTVQKNPDGLYQFRDSVIEVSENAACRLLESLTPALTGLNIYNRPYVLECADRGSDQEMNQSGFLIIAKNTATGVVFAEYLVADDLSSVYRIDDETGKAELISGDAD